MTESSDVQRQEKVFCRRLERPVPVTEHCECLYCFGKVDEVRSGEHVRFCDFDPEKDPVNFGFPEDQTLPPE